MANKPCNYGILYPRYVIISHANKTAEVSHQKTVFLRYCITESEIQICLRTRMRNAKGVFLLYLSLRFIIMHFRLCDYLLAI